MAGGQSPFTLSPAFVQNFNIAPSVSRLPSTSTSTSSAQIPQASTSFAQPKAQSSTYKPPAHKHAHHLHSIPPREKSTRTLIIDHMLWVHGRTRFAQARAELGMTDRTGGPSSMHYSHRHRPENYEEDEQAGSDGEDTDHLKSRALRPADDDEEERMSDQDLLLARSLRLRAEGLEKVVTSMLDQPPVTVHPTDDDDVYAPPTSPNIGPSKHPHVLPNGVRLRLSLGTMINDFFARQAPPSPYRHHHHVKNDKPDEELPASSDYTIPVALEALRGVSSHPSTESSIWAHPKPSDEVLSMYNSGADPSTANAPPALRCPRHLHTSCEICVEAKSRVKLGQSSSSNRHTAYSKSPVTSHSQPLASTPQYSAPSPATSSVYTPSSSAYNLSYNPVSSYSSTYPRAHMSASLTGGSAISGWQDGSGIGSGLSRPGIGGSCLRRKPPSSSNQAGSPSRITGAGNAKLSELIPRFLRLSALVAMELGREMEEDRSSVAGSSAVGSNAQVDPLTRERRGSMSTNPNSSGNYFQPPFQSYPMAGPSSPHMRRASISNAASSQPQLSSPSQKPSAYALQPSREWYMLTAGLLTRAVLEGYLTAGWRGVGAIECLLTVGLGINEEDADNTAEPREGDTPTPSSKRKGKRAMKEGGSEQSNAKKFEEFDPDDLPSLLEATRIMFPSLRTLNESNVDDGRPPEPRTPAEQEYATEMMERLRRFYDIPESTPDLSTHMEDLAWQFPAEPVERAAVRFCEAISRWRGKPELETYSGWYGFDPRLLGAFITHKPQ
ncbi:hypothetical protein ONZ45_g6099 [Pleurotus djamor]|nr:hypothetical protein ONZ45_g6099 [Pleurotus djamor]